MGFSWLNLVILLANSFLKDPIAAARSLGWTGSRSKSRRVVVARHHRLSSLFAHSRLDNDNIHLWTLLRGGADNMQSTVSQDVATMDHSSDKISAEEGDDPLRYGRISEDQFILTPQQIDTFRSQGCVTIDNVITQEEVDGIQKVFDGFMTGEIPPPPGKDFCDMSQPFDVPQEDWNIVNCMLPTRYHPPLRGNVYERLAANMARQLFPHSDMIKDYDQFLNKRPGKREAADPCTTHSSCIVKDPRLGRWALGMKHSNLTDTCTFSLAIDDSDETNGCLRYVAGSGAAKTLRSHQPLSGNRDEGHALTAVVDQATEDVQLAPAKRGSLTIHDEWVVHGSAGNMCPNRQRRTYVVAFRAKEIVDAERHIGFSHSHNDKVNWDTFDDGASHRVVTNKDNN